MADEPTQQQGADGEEASNHSQLMAMMLQLQASIDKIGRSSDNKNRVNDLSEQTSSLRDATEENDVTEAYDATESCDVTEESDATEESGATEAYDATEVCESTHSARRGESHADNSMFEYGTTR